MWASGVVLPAANLAKGIGISYTDYLFRKSMQKACNQQKKKNTFKQT